MKQLFKQYSGLIIIILALLASLIIYKNINKIIDYFKTFFTNIKASDTPTAVDLVNPKYVINHKIINNYVDLIIEAINKQGTDEIQLNKVYQNLKNTSPENTIAVWNNFDNRKLKYDTFFGDFGKIIGEELNLYLVLKSELNNNKSEKNALVNWTWLFKRAGLSV